MYTNPAIRESVPSGSRTEIASEVVEVGKDSTTNVLTSSDKPSKEAEQPGVTEKDKNANQEWPLVQWNSQDPSAEKEAPKKMEIILATLQLPAMADPTSKGLEASKATSTQLVKGPPKERLVTKKK